jgi:predicted TIM-barrel fold metal-dependent hydrolase
MKRAFDELGLIGLKFHPFIQRIDLRDPAMEEIWTICEKLKRPIFLHTGYESFYKRKLSPLCVKDILNRHPELFLVINHACFPDLISAFEMARQFKGVYIDLTNVPGSIPYFQAEFNGRNIKDVLLNGIREFPGRVFFGTDHPVGMGSVEEIFKQYRDLNLSAEEFKSITHDAPLNFINKFKL